MLERLVATTKDMLVIVLVSASDIYRRLKRHKMVIKESLTQVAKTIHLSRGYYLYRELQ